MRVSALYYHLELLVRGGLVVRRGSRSRAGRTEASYSVPVVIDQARLGEVVLFGPSDGGSIALVYAATAGRDRVRALILEAPHVFCEDLSVKSIEESRRRYLEGDLRERLAKHHRHVDVAFWGWNRAWLDPKFREWSLLSYLPDVRCPVLLIQGTEDPYGTIAQLEAIEHGVRGPVEIVLLEDCKHSPHRDQPDRVLELATAFVERYGR
jgi:pimeloyl-ACP methyl ester carboxylesterase